MKPALNTLEKLVDSKRSPAVLYTCFDENQILEKFSKGYTGIKSNQRFSEDTVFPIFSITKTITALAILQLAEKGLLRIDDTAGNYLPDLAVPGTITIRHLLTHTASIGNPIPLKWIHTIEEHPDFNRNEFYKPVLLKSVQTTKTPGTKFNYSNVGYILLGRIIESVSGNTYESYITNNILIKLTTDKAVLSFEINGFPMATGYHKSTNFSMLLLRLMIDTHKYMGKPERNWKPFVPLYLNGTPYGGLFANIKGIVRYGQELLKNQNSLISEHSKQIMFSENFTTDGQATGMCLSWFKGSMDGNFFYTHAGGGGGFYCELRIYPEIHKGSFVILNRSGFSDIRILDKIDQELN